MFNLTLEKDLNGSTADVGHEGLSFNQLTTQRHKGFFSRLLSPHPIRRSIHGSRKI